MPLMAWLDAQQGASADAATLTGGHMRYRVCGQASDLNIIRISAGVCSGHDLKKSGLRALQPADSFSWPDQCEIY